MLTQEAHELKCELCWKPLQPPPPPSQMISSFSGLRNENATAAPERQDELRKTAGEHETEERGGNSISRRDADVSTSKPKLHKIYRYLIMEELFPHLTKNWSSIKCYKRCLKDHLTAALSQFPHVLYMYAKAKDGLWQKTLHSECFCSSNRERRLSNVTAVSGITFSQLNFHLIKSII